MEKESYVKELLSKGKLEHAISETIKMYEKSNIAKYNEAILISARYQKIRRKVLRNTISDYEENLEMAKISESIIELISTSTSEYQTKSFHSWAHLIMIIAIIFITGLFLSYKIIFISKDKIIQNVVYINETPARYANVKILETNEEFSTDSSGRFTINILDFESESIQFHFKNEEVDTIIQKNINTNSTEFVFRLYSNKASEQKSTNKSNQIINSEKSVIQEGDHSEVNFD